jgi:hypothetical protein
VGTILKREQPQLVALPRKYCTDGTPDHIFGAFGTKTCEMSLLAVPVCLHVTTTELLK